MVSTGSMIIVGPSPSAVHLASVAAYREGEQGATARDVGEHGHSLAREVEPVVRHPDQDPARPQSLREPRQDDRQGQVMQGADAGDGVIGHGGQRHLGDIALLAADVGGNDPTGRLDHLRRPVHRVYPPGPLRQPDRELALPHRSSTVRTGSARSSQAGSTIMVHARLITPQSLT
jgi:hypothetical protein